MEVQTAIHPNSSELESTAAGSGVEIVSVESVTLRRGLGTSLPISDDVIVSNCESQSNDLPLVGLTLLPNINRDPHPLPLPNLDRAVDLETVAPVCHSGKLKPFIDVILLVGTENVLPYGPKLNVHPPPSSGLPFLNSVLHGCFCVDFFIL